MSTPIDELEQRPLAAFGEDAAEIDRRAREVSGLGEVKFPAPTGDDGCLFAVPRAAMKLTTLRRLIGAALYAAALAPLIDAAINIASFPR